MQTTIRPANGNDIHGWYGRNPGTMRAVIVEIDGKPIAIGGVMHKHGALMAFMDMKPEAHDYPIAIMRGTYRAIRDIFSHYQIPIYATISEELESAPRYLRHIGFIKSNVHNGLMVYSNER